jgi:ATP-dependent DNA helicase RecG
MNPLSNDELEVLLADLESASVERKSTLDGDAPTKVREAACAFMNDLGGSRKPGVVFVGAKDDGSWSGAVVDDRLLLNLAAIQNEGTLVPPPTMTVEKRRLRGAEFAVVTVWPTDSPPAKFKGRIFVRTGPRRSIATAQDERILNERRRFGDAPFDVRRVAGASVSDLDLVYFKGEYLPSAFALDVLAANERTIEQRLAATKMIASVDDPAPTVAGLLTLSYRTLDFLPNAYVQFVRLSGIDEASPVVDSARLDGRIADVIRGVEAKFAAHNTTAVDFTSATLQKSSAPYPIVALQQVLRNAVMHRSYEATNAPVRASWYSDRVEIISPGGPFGAVRVENFGGPGVADYRNPNLAEVLRALGFVQRFGFGIETARKAMRDNGNPEIEFHVDASFVRVVLRTAS